MASSYRYPWSRWQKFARGLRGAWRPSDVHGHSNGRVPKLLCPFWSKRKLPISIIFVIANNQQTVTGHSSVVLATENMVSQSLKLIRPILKGEASQVEIKKQAEVDWATDIQKACKRTVLHTGGCQSWYKTDSGWNSTIYP